MDQPSDTPNDNPFKPEEEASFNESATESTGTSAPVEVKAEEPEVIPSPFVAPEDPVTETTLPPATPVAPAAPMGEDKKRREWIPFAIAGGVLILLGGIVSVYYLLVH